MLIKNPLLFKLLAEGDAVDTGGDKEDTPTVDIFNDDNDDKEDNSDDDVDDKEDDKEDKDKKEPEEELTRLSFKELKTEFPELFKKFPEIKEVLFREKALTEIFPTVEEANKAAQTQAAYDDIVASVVEGDTDKFISELATEDAKGVERFAGNFLDSVEKHSKELYLDLVSPVVAKFLKGGYEKTKEIDRQEDRENAQKAYKIVRKLLFGGSYEDIEKEIKPVLNRDKDKDDKDKEERKNELGRAYYKLRGEIGSDCKGLLNKEILKGLDDLKAESGLQKMMAKEIAERVIDMMDRDELYLGKMNNLWKREERNRFSGSLKSSFTTTFLSKAKTLIAKVRSEVRKEMGKEIKVDDKDKPTRLGVGKESKNTGERMTPERAKKEGLTTRGIFDA